MIREATPQDQPRIEAFLARHPETSMFLRSNLAAHGVGFSDHPHSTRFFLWEGEGLGVFAVSRSGYVMAQMPGMSEAGARAFRSAIAGHTVLGMTGDVAQVDVTLRGLGLEGAEYKLQRDEPLFRRDLADLPDVPFDTRCMEEADLAELTPWFARYLVDTGQDTEETAQASAPARAREILYRYGPELLLEDGAPVAMADINAEVAGMVQVGGVFVPPAQRGRGLAGAVTCAILHRARRESGAHTGILFANNPIAARAYERIGFRRVGNYRVALLRTPQEITQ